MSPQDDILIAGIGNIFLGDDGFGVEVVRALLKQGVADGIRVIDFGLRGFDLTYALMNPWRAAILVDAAARGRAPGTLYVIDPTIEPTVGVDDVDGNAHGLILDTHAMNPMNVLRFIRVMGGRAPCLRVVGCEPASFGTAEEPAMGLSPAVARAIAPAVTLIGELVTELRGGASCTN